MVLLRLKMLTWGSSIFARVQSKNCSFEKSGSSFGSTPEKLDYTNLELRLKNIKRAPSKWLM